MRLATVRMPDGSTRAARAEQDQWVLLPHADVGALFADGDREAEGQRVPRAGAVLANPVPHPNKIICLGLNYASHIAEMGRPTPNFPTLFAKYDGALIGPGEGIQAPQVSKQLDWEAELGVVIGRAGRAIAEASALDHVGGYTVVNDVTVRDWQHRTREFLSGKTFESTTPVGPVVVSPDELPPGATGLDIGCSVDGTTMQHSNTSDLLFGVAATIAYISTIITLLPGDLIAMGTPGGVGAGRDPQVFLSPGQELVTWVEGIGELRNPVINELEGSAQK